MTTYKDAGVNIEGVDRVLSKWFNLKEFSASLEVPDGSRMVLSCDGVGTKLKIAQMFQRYDTVGIDLVAMIVNDIITTGARPKYFLDYIGLETFDEDVLNQVIAGIKKGCEIAGCKLVGGETAEMPGVYQKDPLGKTSVELVGFGVGFLEQPILSDEPIRSGDVLLGLPSSGFHSNGYSLLRKVIFNGKYFDDDWQEFFEQDLVDVLLEPTKIYVDDIFNMLSEIPVKGIVHITGGGLRNIQRMIPEGMSYLLNSWKIPKVFQVFQKYSHVTEQEMFNTFNMGIGMVLLTDPESAKHVDLIKVGQVVNVVG
jgi:phosphoribosylformylglycinamidine cyclo-ligase